MITSTNYTLDQTSIAADQYLELLRKAERVTDDLTQALKDWDSSVVNGLLQTRSALCVEIGQMSANLGRLFSESRGNQNDIEAIIVRVEAGQARLMQKQAQIERVLAGEMRAVEESSNSLGRRRNLKAAYGTPARAQHSRFVDSRF